MKIRYYKHKLQNLIVVEDIVIIHYLELKRDYSFPPESHDFWELIYADKDSVIAKTDYGEVVVEEGEMLFHKPTEVHSHVTNGQSVPNVFILAFVCKSRAMRFFENRKVKVSKELAKFIYHIVEEGKRTFNLPHYDPTLTKMEFLKEPALGGEQLIKNYLEILLISLMRAETENAARDVVFLRENEKPEGISARIINYMKENVDKKLSINAICEEVHYNKSYLFNIFKKDTGKTVMEYFVLLKIEKAKSLLRKSNLNVTQISESLSFDTPNYFSKTFKKVTGYTPLQYKKIHLAALQ